MKKLKKKEKKETIGQLVKQLDKVFSEYIRLRDADSDGIVTCYTSGKRAHWKKMQAGHFISRRHYGTRWNEINVQVQSVKDNIFNQGNTPEFGRRLVQDYGQSAVDMLFYLRDTPAKLNRLSLKLLIGQYSEMVEQIKENKKIK